ncbi:hypothetical protein EDEG_02453 [Edhazardia aedis USNM 41457]|uniref:Adenosine kinase n=1 Tax=Edhazardia aedis (strain USNM 41457) TaxID=1003232 RepID=J8ZU19_EDHAE|nr:hypothetical protein EDEG_02453 [Edhazardia aedis USNM 41457]|eukprot:EJW03148.1 hypothetical protein EDEG_02453 [Edhazardia aedis USNM 41457]
MKKILSICQPILDKVCNVSKNELLKYNLATNGHTKSNFRTSEIEEMSKNIKKTVSAGGSSLNTILLLARKEKDKTFGFIGAIGNDTNGLVLKNEMVKNSPNNNLKMFLETVNHPTAECCVYINGIERSMVTNVGAANKLSKDHLRKHLTILKISDVVYISAFFAHDMQENATWVIDNMDYNQTLVFNLSFQGLFHTINKQLLNNILKRADILIGNREEFISLYECIYGYNHHESIDQMLIGISHFAQTYFDEDLTSNQALLDDGTTGTRKNTKALFCTDANRPTMYYFKNTVGTIQAKNVDMIVCNTNGAGDAFAAGIISSIDMIYEGNIETAVIKAHDWAFDFIIERSKFLTDKNTA